MTLRTGSSLLVTAVILFPGIGHAGLFGPSNYDECITETMKGVSSDVAARAIMASCRNQFPDQADAATRVESAAEQQAVAPAPQQQAPTPQPEAPAPQRAPAASGPGRSLTPEELSNLRSSARVFGSTYNVTIENTNEHLTITEVSIAVWDEAYPRGLQEYRQDVRIEPLGSSKTKYTVYYKGDDQTWAWKVASAKGVE